ncbi:HSP20 family protein [Catalinimonas alkaloidigena]|uniref:HSP20 family protein n=1 Tax=Catalinimonas alkaloidigena TaxID=1075417 RepID=A0A1G9NZ92_9BACT|nr:Hsp20/alpha crystallin family protein [Catalinimonas alkaloidigena]SDL91671.1 HSP20 family protein [Catalinimonas alkaloidigena]
MALLHRNFPALPETDALLADLFDDERWTNFPFGNGRRFSMPAVNVLEHADRFEVEVAAPGLRKKDFRLQIDGGVLTISAETKEEHSQEAKTYTRREFNYRSFRRTFTLPDSVDAEQIRARYDGGILHLSLPKQEKARHLSSREIKIN